MYSTNITPDRETGIGQYSDAEFLAAVHRGVRRDGARLYPAMPFASYAYLTDADALAIKAYLFSLEPINAPAIPNTFGFPFDQRWSMGIWAMMFDADRRFEPHADRSARVESRRLSHRGARPLRGMPYAAQPVPGARQPPQIRRRRHRRLARL